MRKKFFLTIVLILSTFLLNAQPIVGKDAPEDFKWSAATEKQASYAILSLDGKDKTFYVDTGMFFAPVKISGSRDIYTRYSSKITDELKFYTRKQDGKTIYFTEAFKVDSKGLKDFVIVIFPEKDNEFLAKAIDISLEKMPLASLSIVNLSPYKLGLAADKSFAKLDTFKSYSKKFNSSKEEILACTLKMYDLKNADAPRHLTTKTYSFWTSKRIVVMFFDLPRGADGQSQSSHIVMYDKGPRK